MLTPMCLVRRTPLDSWIAESIGHGASESPLPPEALTSWQSQRRSDLLAMLRRKSPFYRRLLRGFSRKPCNDDLWSSLPFTTADDIREHGSDMLCVSHSKVARVISLPTSGTTGRPKRMYFTESDLERTVDFFHHGMSTFTMAGQRVLVLMPGENPISIGGLLREALLRLGCETLIHWPIHDPGAALAKIDREQADVLVCIPIQVLAMARHPMAEKGRRLCAVLLSTDYVAPPVRHAIEKAFNCPVYAHWGMTETGYGGAVECSARQGYHLRADLLAEIINPKSGKNMPPGKTGELVITTLAAQALPLLRYRTGDLSSLLVDTCACGCRLPRLGDIRGRVMNRFHRGSGQYVSMPVLDDMLLTLPWILNYQAAVRRSRDACYLDIELFAPSFSKSDPVDQEMVRSQTRSTLNRAGFFKENKIRLGEIRLGAPAARSTGSTKRCLLHHSKKHKT